MQCTVCDRYLGHMTSFGPSGDVHHFLKKLGLFAPTCLTWAAYESWSFGILFLIFTLLRLCPRLSLSFHFSHRLPETWLYGSILCASWVFLTLSSKFRSFYRHKWRVGAPIVEFLATCVILRLQNIQLIKTVLLHVIEANLWLPCFGPLTGDLKAIIKRTWHICLESKR